MALVSSVMVDLGTPAPDFNLKGIDDKMHSLESFNESDVLVVVFMCNHCPYVQNIWPRLNELSTQYENELVQFVGINPNANNPAYPQDNFEEMKKAPKEYGHNFPYLIDEDQSVAKAYEAVCTPDIFVYNKERKLVYRGVLLQENVSDSDIYDLSDALEDLAQGKQVNPVQTPSSGCSIKWLT